MTLSRYSRSFFNIQKRGVVDPVEDVQVAHNHPDAVDDRGDLVAAFREHAGE